MAEGDDLTEEGQKLAEEAAELDARTELLKERGKYTAAAWDRASTALLTLGLISPAVGAIYKLSALVAISRLELGIALISCLGVALILHWVGRGVLEKGLQA